MAIDWNWMSVEGLTGSHSEDQRHLPDFRRTFRQSVKMGLLSEDELPAIQQSVDNGGTTLKEWNRTWNAKLEEAYDADPDGCPSGDEDEYYGSTVIFGLDDSGWNSLRHPAFELHPGPAQLHPGHPTQRRGCYSDLTPLQQATGLAMNLTVRGDNRGAAEVLRAIFDAGVAGNALYGLSTGLCNDDRAYQHLDAEIEKCWKRVLGESPAQLSKAEMHQVARWVDGWWAATDAQVCFGRDGPDGTLSMDSVGKSQLVVLHGLRGRPELNGREARVTEKLVVLQRVGVRLEPLAYGEPRGQGEQLSVKPENLQDPIARRVHNWGFPRCNDERCLGFGPGLTAAKIREAAEARSEGSANDPEATLFALAARAAGEVALAGGGLPEGLAEQARSAVGSYQLALLAQICRALDEAVLHQEQPLAMFELAISLPTALGLPDFQATLGSLPGSSPCTFPPRVTNFRFRDLSALRETFHPCATLFVERAEPYDSLGGWVKGACRYWIDQMEVEWLAPTQLRIFGWPSMSIKREDCAHGRMRQHAWGGAPTSAKTVKWEWPKA